MFLFFVITLLFIFFDLDDQSCILETIEELKKSFPQELLNFDYLKSEEISPAASPTADEAVSQYTILSQLDLEMANM
ncbi:hypothetical protein FEM48_Zijuj10G0012500 [Ziziphus jujuba var. spinosa]|uniref:Uncharacterized protein n=1 Tax=Ziziphus jujuba var. spinosa TaxID=714518 RepID=A0A978UKF2_ZIZJJ|nr:hypothetical protein FEM48_Zijuj10G0012500 [Ziziphus jujuba var. spinosa]